MSNRMSNSQISNQSQSSKKSLSVPVQEQLESDNPFTKNRKDSNLALEAFEAKKKGIE